MAETTVEMKPDRDGADDGIQSMKQCGEAGNWITINSPAE